MQVVELLLRLQEGALGLAQMLAAHWLLDLLTRRYGRTVDYVHEVLGLLPALGVVAVVSGAR